MLNKIYFIAVLLLLPIISLAANTGGKLTQTSGILESIKSIISDTLIPIAFTLALLYFFYGVAKYIKSEGAGKAEGKSIMIWGVVALFVISSVWGIVTYIRTELNITGSDTNMKIPNINAGTSL